MAPGYPGTSLVPGYWWSDIFLTMTDLLLILISDACGLLPLIRLYCVEIEITKTEKMYCQFRDMLSGWPPVSVGNSYACVLILLLVIILPKMFIPGHSSHHWYLWYPATSVLYRTRGQVGTYQGTYADIAEGDQHGRSLDPICYSVPSQMVVQKSANPKIDYACFLILLLPKMFMPGHSLHQSARSDRLYLCGDTPVPRSRIGYVGR